ncbi:hypothetical protein DICVIV_02839 [Dictyocaulus viviparus]|uniref:Neurotransmitter-gated ion-channel ligand-binding domain-containing protein n=1 Tax=Dictyocaulus viviparus TaxID=29172 RepID=A0A0D8Y8S1_DICVI|nr:hypothetical protein DICVIV_02839 [Dictyocaulus viviparus]
MMKIEQCRIYKKICYTPKSSHISDENNCFDISGQRMRHTRSGDIQKSLSKSIICISQNTPKQYSSEDRKKEHGYAMQRVPLISRQSRKQLAVFEPLLVTFSVWYAADCTAEMPTELPPIVLDSNIKTSEELCYHVNVVFENLEPEKFHACCLWSESLMWNSYGIVSVRISNDGNKLLAGFPLEYVEKENKKEKSNRLTIMKCFRKENSYDEKKNDDPCLLEAIHPIYSQLDSKSIPMNDKRGPLDVHVGFYVESLGNFRSTEMTFDMDLYLYMSWRDNRMKHNGSDYILINDKSILDKIWLPDLYFANARTAYFHEVTVHNFNMFVAPDGTIAYGTRVTLNLGEYANKGIRNPNK